MKFKNLEGTLETRAKDNGRAIDSQWIYENETKEINYEEEKRKLENLNKKIEKLGNLRSNNSSNNKSINDILVNIDKMFEELDQISKKSVECDLQKEESVKKHR